MNEHLSLLVGRYVPTKVIRVHNKDKPWFDDQCGRSFGLKKEGHLPWTCHRFWVSWEWFVRRQVRANETYSETKRKFIDRNVDVLMNVQSPHKLWSTLKSPVLGSLPLLVGGSGGLVCESVGTVGTALYCRILLTASSEGSLLICRPLTCHPSPSVTTFAFRSSEVRRLLLNSDAVRLGLHLSKFSSLS